MRTTDKANRPIRVGLISLGCAKNLVDAEIMLGSLLKGGVEITNDAEQADAVIVNTCSFIDAAQEESVDTILESAEVREAGNRGQALIVSGCLPQRFRDDLPKLLPEVDAFMGIDQVAQVGDIVQQALQNRAAKIATPARRGSADANHDFGMSVSGAVPSPSPRPSPQGRGRTMGQSGNNSSACAGPPIPLRSEAESRNSLSPRERAGVRGKGGHGFDPRSKSAKADVSAKLVELDKSRASDEHDHDESLRGTEKFGKTKTVLTSIASITEHGTRNTPPIVTVNQRPTFIPDFDTPRFRLTPKHFAYVKIAEGCNHPCSFCIIPRMRGSHRSRTQADIVSEARQLIADGVKELNLISQDSTYYGLDLRANHSRNIAAPDKFNAAAKSLPADATTLCTLLRELNALPGDFWIRLLYTHPAHWTDELIQTIAECPKVARYVDMPLQHIHENMLERMRRETSQQYIVDLIAKIRAGIPGIALRTTFIVGFPGETEAYFQALLDFIRETKFERLGVFTYSKEDATRAAGMAGQIPDATKKKRRERAMAEQHKIAVQVSESFVGRRIRVLVEREAKAKELQKANVFSWEHGLIREAETQNSKLETRNYSLARGEADAPDIDGRVYVRGRLSLGEFARVKIVGHTDYDLIAEPD